MATTLQENSSHAPATGSDSRAVIELPVPQPRETGNIGFYLEKLRRFLKKLLGKVMTQLAQRLKQGSTLGPLSVLVILAVYALVSPHLPEAFREYVYQILPH